jgi:phage recombination protein Bet
LILTQDAKIMNTALSTLSNNLSIRLGMGESGREVVETLKATAFKGGTQVTDAQMSALMIVANQYSLNPFTREIFAFPDKGGIVPVVSVDGWSRIINEHSQFDGLEFVQDDESCTCIIYRKDRSHPVKVTEYMSECKRDNAQPWKTHPKRMLRHKSLIQCARLAFGFAGIYDQDEAERIIEVVPKTGEVILQQKPVYEKPELPNYPDDKFQKNKEAWKAQIDSGKQSAESIIKKVSTVGILTDAQIKEITQMEVIEGELQ